MISGARERRLSSVFGSPSDSRGMESPRNTTGFEISEDHTSECRGIGQFYLYNI